MTTSSKTPAQGAVPDDGDLREEHTAELPVESSPPAEDTAERADKTKAAAPVTRELPAVQLNQQAEQPAEQEREGDSSLSRSSSRLSRPRKTTLAMAITRPPASSTPPAPSDAELPTDDDAPTLRRSHPSAPKAGAAPASAEIADEADEWSIADQPTVYLPPDSIIRSRTTQQEKQQDESADMPDVPDAATHEDDDGEGYAPRPRRPSYPAPPSVRRPAASRPPITPMTPLPPGTARPPYPPRREPRETRLPLNRPNNLHSLNSPNNPNGPRRLASPDGRPMPGTPPTGVPRAALPDPRMERFQRLREGRMAHQEGERAPDEPRHVTEIVRQWWRDLRPNLNNALNYQREARASGVHPIPAHEPTQGSWLGDAFGRLAASARGMTERAQQAMAPQLNRLQELHGHAENAANAFVQKLEGPAVRQQAPLLGPGRIAVFFKQGVTVGQAQALLSASHARPIRLIPRKHGFLALVAPGEEAEISERLRDHPYVRDVAYLEYNEYGEAIPPR
jgi:hypothetical protein